MKLEVPGHEALANEYFKNPEEEMKELMRLAKYAPGLSPSYGRNLLKRADIQARIQELQEEKDAELIMGRQRRLELITEIIKDDDTKVADRLKAIETLDRLSDDKEKNKDDDEPGQRIIINIPDNKRD